MVHIPEGYHAGADTGFRKGKEGYTCTTMLCINAHAHTARGRGGGEGNFPRDLDMHPYRGNVLVETIMMACTN